MTSFSKKKGQDDVAEASRLIVEHFFFFPAYGPKYYEVSDWITKIIIT